MQDITRNTTVQPCTINRGCNMSDRDRLFWIFLAVGLLAGGIAMGVPHEFEASQPLSAQAMNENFRALENRLNAQAGVPVGTVIAFAGPVAPEGWLPCDGRVIARAEYPALFTAIGTVHGDGDGASTFNLPDLQGRVVAGHVAGGSASSDLLTVGGSGVDGRKLGSTGGDEHLMLHSHAAGGLVAETAGDHTHPVDNTLVANPGGGRQYNYVSGERFTTTHSSGAAGAHSHVVVGETSGFGNGTEQGNVQPTMVLQYIIKR